MAKLNLTNCKGDVGPVDMFPAFTPVEPGPGTACLSCYQVWGEAGGVKDQNLVMFEEKMQALRETFENNI